jgi:hypothetical protein
MLGFVSAVGVELASGKDLFSQLATGGVPLFVGSAVLFTVASLIPMFKGVSKESKSQAIMSVEAEMLNGRFAMLGLIALALLNTSREVLSSHDHHHLHTSFIV